MAFNFMKIEINNKSFKKLVDAIGSNSNLMENVDISEIYYKELKPQYQKYFEKYKDEKQEFKIKDKVKFKCYGQILEGRIHKIYRLANGKYHYIIEYKDYAYATNYTNPLTKKNIQKIL
jgi:hypothetical protein